MNSKNKFTLLILGVVLVTLFWISWVTINPSNNKAMATFISVKELTKKNINKRIKLGGLVKNGSINISKTNQLNCSFILKEGESELNVKFGQTRPDLFKDGSEVIVAGLYIDGIFYADELQTKCASRYEGDLRNEKSYNLTEIQQ